MNEQSSTAYYERLLDESLQRNNESLKELEFMASAGEAVAQYHLALYYEQTSKDALKDNKDYVWWIGKAAKANYQDSVSRYNAVKPVSNYPQYQNVQPFFKHLLSPEGRITRTEFFTILLLLNVIYFIFYAIFQGDSSETPIVLRLILVPLSYLCIMAGAKRCHDSGTSGISFLIPFYNIYLVFASGDKGKNKYGPDPRGEVIQP